MDFLQLAPLLNSLTTLLIDGQYTVISTDSNGCIGNSLPQSCLPKPINFRREPPPVCKGQTIILTSSGGTTYQWTGPNGFYLKQPKSFSFPTRTFLCQVNIRRLLLILFWLFQIQPSPLDVNPLAPNYFDRWRHSLFENQCGFYLKWRAKHCGLAQMATSPPSKEPHNKQCRSLNGWQLHCKWNGCQWLLLKFNLISQCNFPTSILSQPQNLTVGLAGGGNFPVCHLILMPFSMADGPCLGFQNLTNGGQYLGYYYKARRQFDMKLEQQ